MNVATAEDFLPGIFRRRKSPNLAGLDVNPQSPNLLYQAGPQASLDDPTAPSPAALPPPNIATAPAPQPMATAQAPDPTLQQLGAPPVMVTQKNGRPDTAIGGDALSRNQALTEATDQYQPQKAQGWWSRWVKPALTGAGLGFLRGGLPGAAGGAGFNLIRTAANPSYQDESWKRRKQGELAGQAKTIYAGQKEGREARKTEAEIGHINAQTATEKAGKWIIKEDEHGVYRPVNQATGLDPQGNPVKGSQTTSSDWELKTDQAGNYVPVNKKTGLDQNGQPVVAKSMVRMGDGWVDVTEKYKADTAAGQAGVTNDVIEQNIRGIQVQQAKIDEALKTLTPTIETTDIFGTTKTIENPEYRHALDDRNRLDAEIRDWKGKRKSPPPSTAPSKSGQRTYRVNTSKYGLP